MHISSCSVQVTGCIVDREDSRNRKSRQRLTAPFCRCIPPGPFAGLSFPSLPLLALPFPLLFSPPCLALSLPLLFFPPIPIKARPWFYSPRHSPSLSLLSSLSFLPPTLPPRLSALSLIPPSLPVADSVDITAISPLFFTLFSTKVRPSPPCSSVVILRSFFLFASDLSGCRVIGLSVIGPQLDHP